MSDRGEPGPHGPEPDQAASTDQKLRDLAKEYQSASSDTERMDIFGVIVELIGPNIRKYFSGFNYKHGSVFQESDVDDMVQDASIKLQDALLRYQELQGTAFLAFVRTICSDMFIDKLRSLHVRQKRAGINLDTPLRDSDGHEVEAHEIVADSRNDVAGVDERIDLSIIGDILQEAMKKLTEDQQVVVSMRIWEGKTFPEIAQVIGRSPGATKQLFVRAKRTLQREIEKQYPEYKDYLPADWE